MSNKTGIELIVAERQRQIESLRSENKMLTKGNECLKSGMDEWKRLAESLRSEVERLREVRLGVGDTIISDIHNADEGWAGIKSPEPTPGRWG